MKRAIALLAAAAVVAGAGYLAAANGDNRNDTASAQTTVDTGTATVVRKTLTEQDTVDGTLGYGDARGVVNRGQGTITGIAPVGSVVDRNGVLYHLDAKPVRLLHGDTPAYRRMADGMPDGADVRQVEDNLKALGHFKGKPDATWDAATTAAVKKWQKANGEDQEDQDGVIEDGEVVFLPGAARIAKHKADIGSTAQPGGAVLDVTGTTRLVDVDLDARRQRLAKQGAKVEVELPDGKTTSGTITSVGTVATAPSGGSDDSQPGGGGGDEDPTIPVVVTLDDPNAGGNLDGAPVDVRLTSESRENVLAVPVNALLALAEGGYGVEQPNGSLVKVETGMFDDGYVEISGDGVREGMTVVVPK